MMQDRINALDSYRTLAILSVILFHFYSRWATAKIHYYPYTDKYDFFAWGRYGVQFFFIISGFVIFYSLQSTSSFILFWKKRMIRLFPSMLIASVLTFTILSIWDRQNLFPESSNYLNFLPGLLFIHPPTLTAVSRIFFEVADFRYLSGSYWSLWLEIQFYLMCSIIYFLNKEKFLRNITLISSILISFYFLAVNSITNTLLANFLPDKLYKFLKILFIYNCNLGAYLSYFVIGILLCSIFNKLEAKKTVPIRLFLFLAVILVIHFLTLGNSIAIFINLIIFGFFIFFIFYPKHIILNSKIVINIGKSSYFLYLIHDPIGILTIHYFGVYFYPLEFILPLCLIIIFCSLSILYYKNIEKKITLLLHKLIT